MKAIILAAAAATVLGAGVAAADTSACNSMLVASLGMQLDAQGIDTSNICDATLAQLVAIKDIVESDGMNGATKTRIETILGQN